MSIRIQKVLRFIPVVNLAKVFLWIRAYYCYCSYS